MEDYQAFLNQLLGRWTMTGKMGEIELLQDVDCKWTLGNRFLQMYFKSTTLNDNPTSKYEAIYHIGFNLESSLYILHLLDTTEVPVDCIVGRGKREGNSIPFSFQYRKTVFINNFTWYPDVQKWGFLQEAIEKDTKKVFATKEMIKLS